MKDIIQYKHSKQATRDMSSNNMAGRQCLGIVLLLFRVVIFRLTNGRRTNFSAHKGGPPIKMYFVYNVSMLPTDSLTSVFNAAATTNRSPAIGHVIAP